MTRKSDGASGAVPVHKPVHGLSAGERRRLQDAADVRRWRGALALAGAIWLGVALAAALRSPALHVRAVSVSGLRDLTPEESRQALAAAAVEPGTGWVYPPLGQIEQALAALPHVASARARRATPPRLSVSVVPRRPVCVVKEGSGASWEIDAGGVVVRAARPGKSYPLVELAATHDLAPGKRLGDPAALAALSTVREFGPGRPVRLAKITVDNAGELCLNMCDTVAIRMGYPDDMAAKIAQTHRIYAREPGIGRSVETIDLRWPDAPACKPRRGAVGDEPDTGVMDAPSTAEDAGAEPAAAGGE